MSIESLCSRDAVTFEDRTRTTTAGGGGVFTHAGTTTYRCCVQPLRSSEQLLWEQRGKEVMHQIFTSSEPPWGNGDRLDFGGTKLKVEGKPVDQAGEGRVWRTLVQELEHRQ